MKHPAVVPPSAVTIYRPGQACTTAQPADFALVEGHGITSSGIRGCEWVRKPRGVTREEWDKFWRWSHVAPILGYGPNAIIMQETIRGVHPAPLASLTGVTFALVHVQCTPPQRDSAAKFIEWTKNTGYGIAQIPADAVNAAFGIELSLGIGDTMTCSTQATRAGERMGLIPDRSPDAVTPAHFGWYFDAAYPGV